MTVLRVMPKGAMKKITHALFVINKRKMTMGMTRRNFIKFAVGGTAGIGLTPLPYKLIDDVAIWTQNWPWVPVPPKGEFTAVKVA